MEETRYLIDTNAVIDYLGSKIPDSGINFMNSIVDDIPNVSVITKIELLSFDSSDEHNNTLRSFIGDSTVLDLSVSIVDASIEIRKRRRTKLPDAIIAATALVYGFVLVTRNTSDFKDIDGLKLLDPHTL